MAIGVVCADVKAAGVALFREAAVGLGAQVTVLDGERLVTGTGLPLEGVIRLLGRLYQAVECQDLPAAVVRQWAAVAPMPVFDALVRAADGFEQNDAFDFEALDDEAPVDVRGDLPAEVSVDAPGDAPCDGSSDASGNAPCDASGGACGVGFDSGSDGASGDAPRNQSVAEKEYINLDAAERDERQRHQRRIRGVQAALVRALRDAG